MPLMPPLPESVRKLLAHNTHPALQLDKYVESWDPSAATGKLSERVQRPAVQKVADRSQQPPSGLDFTDLCARRKGMLECLGAASWRAATSGPLTLHLARASALENAGICLHSLYGFAFLPGSGLKGMARAYAETVWLPARYERGSDGQPKDSSQRQDAQAAWRQIEAVFGWAPGSDSLKPWKPRCVPDRDRNDREHSGAIVFHDAWPEQWPKLIVDIVNNHHPEYYQAGPEDNGHPPGDWENPVPVYFLAVPPETPFRFALSKRRNDVDDGLLKQAKEWLLGALCHLGAGAKTAAGYGSFNPPPDESGAGRSPRRAWKEGVVAGRAGYEVHVKFRIVSPAFLGGPEKDAQETLRLASVKALCRTWWRAWQGRLTVSQLRKKEADVFGSLERGTRLTILPMGLKGRLAILRRGHLMGKGGSALGYLGYGPVAYEKSKAANVTQFDAIDAGQSVEFRVAHPGHQELGEVLRGMWLLGALGGLGSRSRRGWGSILLQTEIPGLPDLSGCRSVEEYRQAVAEGLESLSPVVERKSASQVSWTALSKESGLVLSSVDFPSWREALEDLGRRFLEFRGRDKRGDQAGSPGVDYHATKALLAESSPFPESLPERAAFGLPYAQAYRSLRKPGDRKPPTATFTPFWREGSREVEGRRASPVICKVVQLSGGRFIWQVAYLPSRFLPDGAKVRGERTDVKPSRALRNSPFPAPGASGVVASGSSAETPLLEQFLDYLEGNVARAQKAERASGLLTVAPNPGAGPPGRITKPVNQGQYREGILLQKRGLWVALLEGDTREAVITNPSKLPHGLSEKRRAQFYIEECSKKAGIRARFEKLL